MEWISVKERFPKRSETYQRQVLAVNMKRGIYQIFLVDYNAEEECFIHPDKDVTIGCGDYCPVEITHWLPIPILPTRIIPKHRAERLSEKTSKEDAIV